MEDNKPMGDDDDMTDESEKPEGSGDSDESEE